MELTDELVRNVRGAIVSHLELLADLEQQLAYERDVPNADVPAELVCGWFDDSYLPDSPAVHAGFREQERAALSDFSARFRSVVAGLPRESRMPLRVWHGTAEWSEVVLAAQAALARLAP